MYYVFWHLLAIQPICLMTDDATAESRVMAMIEIGCELLCTCRNSESFFWS